ncbi:type II toxin-antitoxin system PemK/MazF family toxin [Cesiribacter andamanensis]|uniref:mRNA interferase MazF n=1 Tax=Cesiribacter andamanensis AMV16 TaxID=1279009 RepID=M7MYH5_9BACT|nr:type II toxin-antitoxin system PemK/MazF family toxin [Cesiribacter andamanensis]EMR01503.1 mRNA interferase MazF [Cesiribacter andamanensis AMV16]
MGLSQYDIVLVNLAPTIGSEINKTRPCLILSPDEINNNLRNITVAPMTTKSHPYPTRVKVRHNNQEGWVVIDQIRTIDKARVIKTLGHLDTVSITECKRVIKETFVD